MKLDSSDMSRCLLSIASLVVIIGLAAPSSTQAQTPGTCMTGEATTDLDVGNVRARLYNNGNLFSTTYNVPKALPGHPITPNAIYTMSFLMGGWTDITVGGRATRELHLVASRYSNWEFWPGPIGDDGSPSADCSTYDRIYSIYRDDIERYNQTGEATADLAEWPWDLGAPVLDGDGNPDNYDLAAGDRPALVGDQMTWWVMNDVGGAHDWSRALPIGIEARVTAFAFNKPGIFGNTTFYRYQLRYRGTEPLEEAWLGFFIDADIGSHGDDYIGTDTTMGMVYIYNGDDFDEGNDGYGKAPPALGFSFMEGLRMETDGEDNDGDGLIDEAGEQLGMTRSTFDIKREPDRGRDTYEALRGIYRWQNEYIPVCSGGVGRPYIVNGENVCTGVAHFLFPGDPVTKSFWSAFNFPRLNHASSC